ncbi:hypothetical protein CBR_g48516 [Chara braunii]|uniref:Reverse transcriptase domain-containing protein n=1 Tax=Chara braunii TaxID=69332 RepID=A0A388M2W5_CHABU|nr:hypothetical protein CBR_g48516 [Chara braunii]|eukprot:GBG88904.1 hypothetical protein CBR_g48516 [Chara braunii]
MKPPSSKDSKYWHFEPSEGHGDATPEEQHKEFFSKLVTRLVYTCNYQQSELEKQNQELQQQYQDLKKQHQELANLRRTVQSHEDATRALNSHVLDLEQAAPGPDAGVSSSAPSKRQLAERVDHVVAMLGDISTFVEPTTMNNQLDTLKTEIWLTHLAATHGVDIADLKDKISWEELTRLWKKWFIVDDAPALAINRLFSMTQGNTATRDWLTEWQKIAATPDLDLPFTHLCREFYNRSCAASSLALGDHEQYATFAEIIEKAREIIKTNRAAAHEKSAWQPTYVEKVKTGPRPQQFAAVQSDNIVEDPAATQASLEGDQVAAVQPRSNKKSRGNGKAKTASPAGNGQPAPWVKFHLTEAEYKWRGRYGCCYWCNSSTKHKTSLCQDQGKEDVRPLPTPLMDAGVEVVDLHACIAKIDREFKTQRQDFMVRADLGPRVRRKSQPTQVTLADGHTHKSIDRCIDDVPAYFAPHASEAVSFDILDTKFDMILAMSWLRSEDHPVNLPRRTVHVRDRNGVLVPCTVAPPHPSISCHVVSAASMRASIIRDDIEEMGVCFLHALPPHDASSTDPSSDPRITELIDAYGEVFEGPHGVVPDRPIRHEIILEDRAVPPRGCIYRMSEEELSVLWTQLDDLLEKVWIRPSSSPYGAPVLFVWKKNKDLRLCIYYRKLNARTIKNAGPLPRIDDLLERLGRAKFFSKLDLKSRYHELEIRKEDRYKTAFKTRYGHFEWLVMPFGLMNAPTTFQAAMTTEFRHMLDRFVLIYLDDILVYSWSLDEHVEHLRTVLERLRQAKYKANRDKCKFAQQELEYLGHYVTPQGIRPLADKIEALRKDWVDRLPDIEFAYNISVHPTIGVTPFELRHGGRKGRIFADLLLPRPADIDAACSPAYVRKYRELLAQARANMQKAQVRMQQQANRHRVPCPIRAGDLVWVSTEEFALEQDVSRKLLPKWFGPWSVTAAASDEPDVPSFVINIPAHLTVYPVFHASKLATYTPAKSDDFPGRRSQDPPSMDGHQEVDRVITDRKYGNKPHEYKVTFRACDPDDTRWISGTDLKASAPLIYAHYERQRLAQGPSQPAPPTRNVVLPSDRQLRPRRTAWHSEKSLGLVLLIQEDEKLVPLSIFDHEKYIEDEAGAMAPHQAEMKKQEEAKLEFKKTMRLHMAVCMGGLREMFRTIVKGKQRATSPTQSSSGSQGSYTSGRTASEIEEISHKAKDLTINEKRKRSPDRLIGNSPPMEQPPKWTPRKTTVKPVKLANRLQAATAKRTTKIKKQGGEGNTSPIRYTPRRGTPKTWISAKTGSAGKAKFVVENLRQLADFHTDDLKRLWDEKNTHLYCWWRVFGSESYMMLPIDEEATHNLVDLEQLYIKKWSPAFNVSGVNKKSRRKNKQRKGKKEQQRARSGEPLSKGEGSVLEVIKFRLSEADEWHVDALKVLDDAEQRKMRTLHLYSTGGNSWIKGWKKVKNTYGATTVEIAGQTTKLAKCKADIEQGRTIIIKHLRKWRPKSGPDKKTLTRLLRNPRRIHDLGAVNTKVLFRWYKAAKDFQQKSTRSYLRRMLSRAIKEKTGWCMGADLTVKIRYDDRVKLAEVRKVVNDKIDVLGLPECMRNHPSRRRLLSKEIEEAFGHWKNRGDTVVRVTEQEVKICMTGNVESGSDFLDVEVVKATKKRFQGLVLTPLDRNPGETYVMWPYIYYEAMVENFVTNPMLHCHISTMTRQQATSAGHVSSDTSTMTCQQAMSAVPHQHRPHMASVLRPAPSMMERKDNEFDKDYEARLANTMLELKQRADAALVVWEKREREVEEQCRLAELHQQAHDDAARQAADKARQARWDALFEEEAKVLTFATNWDTLAKEEGASAIVCSFSTVIK